MQTVRITAPVKSSRRGTTLLIVLALLGLLTLLGLVFFSFASQAQRSGENFVEAAKIEPGQPDDGWDYGLENLLVGPPPHRRNSVLHGGRHSIVPNLVGRNSRPGTGTSVNIIYNAAGVPVVDQNRDGIDDDIDDAVPGTRVDNLDDMVDSQVAHAGIPRGTQRLPAPDGGVTYPDQNSAFLGWRGYALRYVPGTTAPDGPWQLIPVIIPSFMRPGLFRTGTTGASVTDPNWYDDPAFVGRSFRPHPDHVFITRDGQTIGGATPVRRFLDPNNPADGPIITSLPGTSGGFPFTPPTIPSGNPSQDGELGVLTATPMEIDTILSDPALDFVWELDVDNDGDSIPDGIWMDFDYPIQEDPNTGAKYTLLYSMHVVDMEGLINLNIHGNLAGFVNFGDTSTPFGGVNTALSRTRMISRSNLGLTPTEVNPLYALMRPTTGGEDQFARFFGRYPADPWEHANMAWFQMLMGRGELNSGANVANGGVAPSEIQDLFAGRFGEPERLFNSLTTGQLQDMPRPGLPGQDDDNDVLEGVKGFGVRGLTHPLDFSGAGTYISGDPRFAVLNKDPSGPMQWLQYNGYSLFSTNGSLGTNVPLGANQQHYYGMDGTLNGMGDDLIIAPNTNENFDHMIESILEPEESRRPFDEVLGAKDLPELHVGNADIDSSGDEISERIQTLGPYTFDELEIRKRFTTMSWRLKNYGLTVPFPPGLNHPFGRDGEPGWAGVDEDGDGYTDRYPNGQPDLDEVGMYSGARTYSEDGFRAGLFSADTALFDSNDNLADLLEPNGRYEFPPQFGRMPAFANRELGTTVRFSNNGKPGEDPFRPQLRRLLRLEAGDTRATFGQLPLNVNRLLDVERLPNRRANLIRGTMGYRPLTEHPDTSESGALTLTNVPTNAPAYPPTDLPGREYWARRDRQKMARDIYVLLYTLGGGNDAVNYTGSNLRVQPGAAQTDPPTSANYGFYTPEQCRAMAQFAVNLVDALDRDDVITRFEYDKNLGETLDESGGTPFDPLHAGWNLDDDVRTSDGFPPIPAGQAGYDAHYPEDSYERGVVYGVERQTLAFTEVLGFITEKAQGDHVATLFDDSDDPRKFLFIELQNLTRLDVPLATSVSDDDDSAIWRIRRMNEDSGNTIESHDRITFLEDVSDVDAGDTFTIGTSDGTDIDTVTNEHRPSDFYVDYDLMDNDFERIVPAIGGGLPTASTRPSDPELQPRTDLDLVHDRDRQTNSFSVNGSAPGVEGLFLPTSLNYGDSYCLILERRANLHLPNLPLAENGWVEVDRVYLTFRTFNLETGDMVPEIEDDLEKLTSEYRDGTLTAQDPDGRIYNQSDYSLGRVNTIGRPNTTGGNPDYAWFQPHFDRDFTSVAELFNLPLFGPRSLTRGLSESMRVPHNASTMQPTDQESAQFQPYGWTGLNKLADDSDPPVMVPFRDRRQRGATPIPNRPRGEGLVAGANARFLLPDAPDASIALPAGGDNPLYRPMVQADFDNRWYQLLAFLEVPTRTHRQLGNPLNLGRVPGPINPNTLRHPEVLAGLVDEPAVADLSPALIGTPGFNTRLGPAALVYPHDPWNTMPSGDNRTDWFRELIASRDGSFPPSGTFPPPTSTASTLYIPGIPGSKPFRSLGHTVGNDTLGNPRFGDDSGPAANPNSSRFKLNAGFSTPGRDLEQTLLRSVPSDFTDTGPTDGIDDNNSARRLFEVGRPADFNSTSGGATMAPMTRHRLLAKILNNTTTTSNTFVVYMTIGHFEVFEDTATGAVRIGGEYDITRGDPNPPEFDRKRAVFIIDRSEAFDAYDSGSGQFDWRRLVKHAAIIR